MPSNYVPYADTYGYGQANNKAEYNRIEHVAAEDISTVRRNQREEFSRSAPPRSNRDRDSQRGDREYYQRRTRTRENDSNGYGQRQQQNGSRQQQRGSKEDNSSSSSSSNSDEQDNRNQRQIQRRSGGAENNGQQQQQQQQQQRRQRDRDSDEDDEESGIGQYFDTSSNGYIAAAAGAGIGAITARRFTGKRYEKHRCNNHEGWKMAGGALAGALAFNAVSNYGEEKFQEWQQQRANKHKGQRE